MKSGPFVYRSLRAALAVSFLAVSAGAADAGDVDPGTKDGSTPVPDGAASCVTSASCGVPTPYCSPTLHTCVECTSDRNCTGGLSCDVSRGICRGCVTDGDCSPARPYCDSSTHTCIECFTDANCGPAGEKCSAGKCGSCGDGICGRRERIVSDSFSPVEGDDSVTCPEDCQKLCPGHDLKSKLGKGILSGSFVGEHQLFGVYCVAGDGADVTATWMPPHTGTFFVGSRGSSAVSITTWTGDCSGMGPSTQCSVTNPGEYTSFNFMNTDPIMIVIRPATNITGTYSLDITDTDPSCDSGDCTPVGPVTPPMHDGGVSSAAAALCLANARARNEEICAGTECACSHCPQDYDDCGVIPGCNDIRACMTDKGCIGADCYISGQCRKVIDTNGSLGGPAFRAASGLQSCALSLKCELPCSRGEGADAGDAGAADAGLACTPRRAVSCPCEGGVSGTKVCNRDGSGFGQCVCDEPPLTPLRPSGCDCSIGGRSTPAGTALAVLGAVVALSSRRRRSRVRRQEEERT